jgi:hypothetical protein
MNSSSGSAESLGPDSPRLATGLRQPGSAKPLQFSNAAGVIEMGVRVYDELELVRFVPGGAIGAGRTHILSGNRNSQHEEQNDSTAHLTIVIPAVALPRHNPN